MNQPLVTSGPESVRVAPSSLFNFTADEQEAIWQQILHHSLNGLVGLSAVRDDANQIINFRYRFVNHIALRDTFRSDPASIRDITGNLLTDFFPSIQQTTLWQTYLQVIATGEPHRVEQNYKVDDRDIWVIQSVSRFGQDGILLSYAETSDLHQAARRVARQSTLLNGVLNSSPNAIVVFEAIRDEQHRLVNFQIALVNRVFETMTNHNDDYFTARTLQDIYPIGTKRMERLRQLLETGEPIHFDEFVVALGRWLDITLTRLNDGFVATVQDITVQKQVSQQLESTVEELRQSNLNLEQFAYVASHDLQEPLRKIVSFSDVLTNQFADELSEPAADLILRMQRSAGRMRSLVQDLLTYARLSGDANSFSTIDLTQLVSTVADDFEMAILDRRANIELQPLPGVLGDTSLLRQLFQNLLSNALKFQQPAAIPHITIRGYVSTLPQLIADRRYNAATIADFLQPGRRYAVIEFIDNGIGFNERYLDRIFTIFQRLHGQMQYSGTGMGLAICKKVVDLHKGHITAISRDGEGATFVLFLPTP